MNILIKKLFFLFFFFPLTIFKTPMNLNTIWTFSSFGLFFLFVCLIIYFSFFLSFWLISKPTSQAEAEALSNQLSSICSQLLFPLKIPIFLCPFNGSTPPFLSSIPKMIFNSIFYVFQSQPFITSAIITIQILYFVFPGFVFYLKPLPACFCVL